MKTIQYCPIYLKLNNSMDVYIHHFFPIRWLGKPCFIYLVKLIAYINFLHINKKHTHFWLYSPCCWLHNTRSSYLRVIWNGTVYFDQRQPFDCSTTHKSEPVVIPDYITSSVIWQITSGTREKNKREPHFHSHGKSKSAWFHEESQVYTQRNRW